MKQHGALLYVKAQPSMMAHQSPLKTLCYSFNRSMDPANKSLFVMFIDFIESVKAVDDKVVEFKLKYPFALFANRFNLRENCTETCNRQSRQSAFDAHPVGSGPFKFVSAVKDDKIVFEAYEPYNGKYPAQVEKMSWLLLLMPQLV